MDHTGEPGHKTIIRIIRSSDHHQVIRPSANQDMCHQTIIRPGMRSSSDCYETSHELHHAAIRPSSYRHHQCHQAVCVHNDVNYALVSMMTTDPAAPRLLLCAERRVAELRRAILHNNSEENNGGVEVLVGDFISGAELVGSTAAHPLSGRPVSWMYNPSLIRV